MRQWLCDPKILCRKHLLGEHVEIHMFVGHINKGKKVTKFLSNNLLEVESLESRHEELVKEMESRGYKHNSPFQGLLPHNIPDTKIDKVAALTELVNRCPECQRNWHKRNVDAFNKWHFKEGGGKITEEMLVNIDSKLRLQTV